MEQDKSISKKFFLLLYLFLTKCYDEVDIRFIRHTQTAEEVDEHTFFYDNKSGGTTVSGAFKLVNDIIDEEIVLSETNVYIAQASDGDNWPVDNGTLLHILGEDVLPKVQYMTYIQTRGLDRGWGGEDSLYATYDKLVGMYKHFKTKIVTKEADVYFALRALFESK